MSRIQHATPVFRPAATSRRVSSRGHALLACLALGGALLAGCRGRAEFTRGRDLYSRGLYRDAYREFWEAYRLSPSDEYFEACRRAATRVAIDERLKGRRRELRGDLEGALEAYSLGLEYDHRLPPLRNDYARVWESLARVEALEDELRGADARTWEQLRAIRALAAMPSSSPEWRGRLTAAVRAVAEAAIRPLWRSTWAAPLPQSEPALDALIESWLRFREECRLYAWEEENAAFFEGWEEAATSRWVDVRAALHPFLDEAEGATRRLEAARRALRLAEQGARYEDGGELMDALRCYRRARFEDPACEPAARGELRVSRRFTFLSRHAARETMDEERWETAIGLLEQLLRVAPEDSEARRWLGFSRSRLAERCMMLAHRHADAGRPGTALLYAARADELDSAAGVSLARELRASLRESVRPRLRIRFRPLSVEDWTLRRDLWAVNEHAMLRLEDEILEAARSASDAFEVGAASSSSASGGTRRLLSIEDLDFYFSQGVELAGTQRFRYVDGFDLRENEDRRRAIEALASARRELTAVEARLRTARLPGRALAQELTELARWRVRQLEVQVRSQPRALTGIDWSEVVHETVHLRREAHLSGFVRLGERARWLSVDLEVFDQVVSGRPAISLAADPREAPSREEVLLRLARRWGRALAGKVELWRRERLDELLRSGRQDLEAGDLTAATERFALAYFGAADGYPRACRAAAEALAPLLGWEL